MEDGRKWRGMSPAERLATSHEELWSMELQGLCFDVRVARKELPWDACNLGTACWTDFGYVKWTSKRNTNDVSFRSKLPLVLI